MNKLLLLLPLITLAGCVTLSGTYVLKAYNDAGQELSNKMALTASGRHIYSMRNALCISYPGATIVIKDVQTGKELDSESPYKCKK